MKKTSTKLHTVKTNSYENKLDEIGSINDEELLALQAPSEHQNIFDKLNIKSSSDVIKSKTKDIVETSKLEKEYKISEGFKGSHIKDICNKYFLTIRPIDEIEGIISDDAANSISDFIKSNEFEHDNGKLISSVLLSNSNFFILAPREYFEESYKDKEISTYIIFYLPEEYSRRVYNGCIKKHYTLLQVYSSGNDFEESRRLIKYVDPDLYYADMMPTLAISIINIILMLIATLFALTNYFILGLFISFAASTIMLLSLQKLEIYRKWNGYSKRVKEIKNI